MASLSKESPPIEIAVYGKGGIGKSTVSANLSAALALEGRKVLQIGCDPKHDSTRALMGGKSIPTVLEYLRDTPKDLAVTDGILHEGSFGVGCVEAGGPKPGVGCAGRGIISAFEFLDRNHVKEGYDTVVYDVLGDVVCGGFAVPIRSEYADAIFLVTSGEYMALYAANNILRGIRNYDGDERRRVAGIIFNARNLPDEQLRVERFAAATGLPIVVRIPRSPVFAEAERINRTVMELAEHYPEQDLFRECAQRIICGLDLQTAKPLTDEALERCILYGDDSGCRNAVSGGNASADGMSDAGKAPIAHGADAASQSSEGGQGAPGRRPALYGCAFNGAATTAIHLTDAVVIAHAPRACAFYTWQNISSPGRKNLFHRGVLMPSALSPHLECTEIDQHEAVFGATDKLRHHVQEAIERKPGAVVVVSSCVSGIIGDDVLSVERLSTPEVPVIVIPADGDIAGDYMEGIRMCMHGVAEALVDPTAEPKANCVNLIGETGVANDLEINHRILAELLGRMGISINCRFMGDATADEVRNLAAAPLSILASDGQDNRELKEWLEDRYGLHFLDCCMPIGFEETRRFLEKVGAFFGCPEKVAPIVADEQERFELDLAALRAQLAGKRLVITTVNANLDWLLDAASAVGMEVAWIGVLNYLNRELGITAFPDRYPIIESISSLPEVTARIGELEPDFVVSAFAFAIPPGEYIVDNMPMVQQIGFHSGIQTLARWARLQQTEVQGTWINDKELFEKYFA